MQWRIFAACPRWTHAHSGDERLEGKVDLS